MPSVRKIDTLNALANNLHSSMVHVLRQVREVDRDSGLSAPRLSLLSVLVFAGPRRMSELVKIEQVSFAAMSKLVAGLERDGFVARRPDKGDERAYIIFATQKGKKTLQGARDKRVSLLRTSLQHLNAGELQILGQAAALLQGISAKKD